MSTAQRIHAISGDEPGDDGERQGRLVSGNNAPEKEDRQHQSS
jgi:hypothetical protein